VDLEAECEEHSCPLMVASAYGGIDIVQFPTGNWANICAKGDSGQVNIVVATRSSLDTVCWILVERYID
jgi:hypothetical protein